MPACVPGLPSKAALLVEPVLRGAPGAPLPFPPLHRGRRKASRGAVSSWPRARVVVPVPRGPENVLVPRWVVPPAPATDGPSEAGVYCPVCRPLPRQSALLSVSTVVPLKPRAWPRAGGCWARKCAVIATGPSVVLRASLGAWAAGAGPQDSEFASRDSPAASRRTPALLLPPPAASVCPRARLRPYFKK